MSDDRILAVENKIRELIRLGINALPGINIISQATKILGNLQLTGSLAAPTVNTTTVNATVVNSTYVTAAGKLLGRLPGALLGRADPHWLGNAQWYPIHLITLSITTTEHSGEQTTRRAWSFPEMACTFACSPFDFPPTLQD